MDVNELREVVIDDDLDPVIEDVQPEENKEPEKPAEEQKPEQQTEVKPSEQPKDEFNEPSNKAFAFFRTENKQLKSKLELAEQKAKRLSDQLNGKVVISQEDYNRYLESLSLENPEAYQREILNRTKEDAKAEIRQEFEARIPKDDTENHQEAAFNENVTRVDNFLAKTFPEVIKQGTTENQEFWQEINKRLHGDTNEARAASYARLVIEQPDLFVSLAETIHLRHEVANLKSTQAESGRQSRVNQQGATSSSAASGKSTTVTLTPEEKAFAKQNNWPEAEYAAFLARGKNNG